MSSLLLLASTATHTGVDQDNMHDAEDSDDDDSVMTDINESESVSHAEENFVDKILHGEYLGVLERA